MQRAKYVRGFGRLGKLTLFTFLSCPRVRTRRLLKSEFLVFREFIRIILAESYFYSYKPISHDRIFWKFLGYLSKAWLQKLTLLDLKYRLVVFRRGSSRALIFVMQIKLIEIELTVVITKIVLTLANFLLHDQAQCFGLRHAEASAQPKHVTWVLPEASLTRLNSPSIIFSFENTINSIISLTFCNKMIPRLSEITSSELRLLQWFNHTVQ